MSDHPPPLAGLAVLDASRVLAGPFCGQILGDLGAEIVKLERPGVGDETRTWGPPFFGELSAYFLSCNRNKKSITLDLTRPEAAPILARLLDRSDILLENFLPDSAAKLGLRPAELLARHPRLIVCSISGYGRTGPMAGAPGYDFAIQGLSGFMSITGPVGGPPSKVGVAIVDVVTAHYAAIAILAAVHARQSSGTGCRIDLALHDCALASQVNLAQAYLTSGTVPPRQGNAHLQIVPYEAFRTADDWLIVAVGNDGQWRAFCEAVERPDWAGEPRFATNPDRVRHRQELVPAIAAHLKTRSRAVWEAALRAAEVPCAAVRDYAAAFADPQTIARGMKVRIRDAAGREIDLVGSPFRPDRPPTMPPRLGEHNDVVFRELGLTDAEIAELRCQGVVGNAEAQG
ncbi:MAG TPA: CoA transferase [Gemmataceae bacterium]|jgi:crotonobetainyl-CoA:carnitine CoA-transferase CaiB-like acyl-CoA transferase|nr:CoA transferase [Gemmataceae bacterium]